ncbi:CAP Gly-rich domain-containing protein [Naematelia encephala]|uniref:CAP Gly-rich domain-containing protein n=1 Tax=Naematelia encephala TaxID=71784 RepID=A0A1Y2BGN7_9TREE|nr:CAP Gly-rich domain-containing protein [Naematelia encephala]
MVLLSIFVTSPDTHSERRLESTLTISQLKDKLTPITGIQPQYQILRLYRSIEATEPLVILDDESRSLQDYAVVDWNCIKVENLDPSARPGEFSDLSAVEKFELTPEEYASRSDTVQAHLKANKLGRFADTPTTLAHPHPHQHPVSTSVPPPGLVPGARCKVITSEGGLERRGTVRFVGNAEIGKGGIWAGVELDEPVGKGDGLVEGRRYFTCSPLHAVFVRPDKVTVGDYPEEYLLGDDDDEI